MSIRFLMSPTFVSLPLFHQMFSLPSIWFLIFLALASFQTLSPYFISLIDPSLSMPVLILGIYFEKGLLCTSVWNNFFHKFLWMYWIYLTSKLVSIHFHSEKKVVMGRGGFCVFHQWNFVSLFCMLSTNVTCVNGSFPKKRKYLAGISCMHCYYVTAVLWPLSQIAVTWILYHK